MKEFRELSLQGNRAQLEGALTEIEKRLKDGWTRDRDQENKIPGKIYCFSCTETHSRKAAALFVRFDGNTLCVSNIVPLNVQRLDIDQYNEILEEFYTKFVKPTAEALNLEHTLTSDTKEIQDEVSTETAAKLQQFARSANKSTGSVHLLDKERWFDFLVAAHAEDTTLDSRTLARWLEESEGWREDVAYELSTEYEYSRSLLKFYDKKRL